MAKLITDVEGFLKRKLDKTCRVLLINPPVEERRYHWLRWNQPLDLLTLSSWLKQTHKGIKVKLFDFMLPSTGGEVPKRKVKETWRGGDDDSQLWHFGRPREEFEAALDKLLVRSKWVPDYVIVTSLTSYWHSTIEQLLVDTCQRLGQARRKKLKLCLYGNYPRFEPAHAEQLPEADYAFTQSVETNSCPDFELFEQSPDGLPRFFALSAHSPKIEAHLAECLRLEKKHRLMPGKLPSCTVAFFDDDVCGPGNQLAKVEQFAKAHPKQVNIEGICGIKPASLTKQTLTQLKACSFKSLYVEHERLPGGATNESAYSALREFLREEARAKRVGEPHVWTEPDAITGFVNMGFPDDDLDSLVRSTLLVNGYFQSVILKPIGYSPDHDDTDLAGRRTRWSRPAAGSPQWFPYVGAGSKLLRDDYDNLLRWQNVLNKRVRGTTFDFLSDGRVARLARETLVAESWKRHRTTS